LLHRPLIDFLKLPAAHIRMWPSSEEGHADSSLQSAVPESPRIIAIAAFYLNETVGLFAIALD
jgi:hypothetical protein